MPVEDIRYLNEREVSGICGIAVQTLRNYRYKGVGIPYCKVGKSVRYNVKDVRDFMESKKISVD